MGEHTEPPPPPPRPEDLRLLLPPVDDDDDVNDVDDVDDDDDERYHHVRGRKRFGRIAIANCDAAGNAMIQSAIEQAHRAIVELS